MKRSEINHIIDEAINFAQSQSMVLPKFAYQTFEQWQNEDKDSWQEVFDLELGWDVTDFGMGNFKEYGACLFTLRNGSVSNKKYAKPYAEKMMIIDKDQALPYHYHAYKMEDIINRGGGTLCIKCYKADRDDNFDLKTPFELCIDSKKQIFNPGDVVVLPKGSAVTLPQRIYHRIWADGAKVMAWEVSKVNDDHTDNYFKDKLNRFSNIQEDEPIKWVLCNEYSKLFNK